MIGFGVSRLREAPGWPAGLRLLEPGPLAPAAALLAASPGDGLGPRPPHLGDLLASPRHHAPQTPRRAGADVTAPDARRPLRL